MKFSIVLSTDQAKFDAVVFKGSFVENISRIAKIGYDGVELAIRDPASIDVAALNTALASTGLVVPAIGTGQAYGEDGLSFTAEDASVRQAAVARIKSHIHLAAQLDAVVILGLIRGVTPPTSSQARAMERLIEALIICAVFAADHGVRLALEPINRYETDLITTIDQGLALIDQVETDALGLLPDTFHMNIEEVSIEDSIRNAASRIYHFHVADSNRWYPGAGHLDFKHMLSVLKDINYTGWVSAETLPHPDTATAAEQGLAHLLASS
jgi:sugar phosphate isomerase/epimerase